MTLSRLDHKYSLISPDTPGGLCGQVAEFLSLPVLKAIYMFHCGELESLVVSVAESLSKSEGQQLTHAGTEKNSNLVSSYITEQLGPRNPGMDVTRTEI